MITIRGELTAEKLLEEVGYWYGDFWIKDGKYYIDNGEQTFCYDTPEEGLIDWLDTMLDSNEDEDIETWSKREIAFVEALKEERR